MDGSLGSSVLEPGRRFPWLGQMEWAGEPDSRTRWDTDSSKPATNQTWRLRGKKKYEPVPDALWVS